MVRLKNRYIVVEIQTKYQQTNSNSHHLKLNTQTLQQSIQNKVQQLHGDFGIAATRAGFQAKYINEITKIGIIRCRHGPHKLVTSVLPFITTIESHKVSVNILYIGATIRKCFKFVKLYQERKCDEASVGLTSEEARQYYRDIYLNFERVLGGM